jgi:hypothetical protein
MLGGSCFGARVDDIPILGDVTMAANQKGIKSSAEIGDVSQAAGRDRDACVGGNTKACDKLLDGLEAYNASGGLSYSGDKDRESSQFTDTRLEVINALINLAGGYLFTRESGYAPERDAAIDPWLRQMFEFYGVPKSYFQDNHLSFVANANAIAYRLYGDETYKDRVLKQWAATFAGMRKDGSFPTETQRGASAIHYTNLELLLILQEAEYLLPRGINLYKTPEVEKLHKAVKYALDALENWDVILKYAKANRAPLNPNWRKQEFNHVRLWNYAYFIYMERFPHHPNTQRIRKLMLDPRTCDQDDEWAPGACYGDRKARVSLLSVIQQDLPMGAALNWVNGYCAYGPVQPMVVRSLDAVDPANDPFGGKYAVSWELRNVNHPDKVESLGQDILELAAGGGHLVPVPKPGRMGPPDANRKALSVEYDGKGKIVVSGPIDLFDEGRALQTSLVGSLKTGVIEGTWPDGDKIKLTLSKLP